MKIFFSNEQLLTMVHQSRIKSKICNNKLSDNIRKLMHRKLHRSEIQEKNIKRKSKSKTQSKIQVKSLVIVPDLEDHRIPTQSIIKDSFEGCISTEKEERSITFNQNVINEFQRDNIIQFANSEFDPEQFLKPTSSYINLIQREVDVTKVYQYLDKYMKDYYNLSVDANPRSKWRENLDNKLLKNFYFIIPILCNQVINSVLKNEEAIVTLDPNVIVFGDIHGNLNDIYYINEHIFNSNEYSNYKFLFLGDYVDRGTKSVEVMLFLFTMKLINPQRYILLRGNHEVGKVNNKYGFRQTIKELLNKVCTKKKCQEQFENFFYNSFNNAFNHLPVGAVIRFKKHKGIFCCHGGVPNEVLNNDKPWTIDALKNLSKEYKPNSLIPRKHSSNQQCAFHELLWNDPLRNSSSKKFTENKNRGGHCSKFSEEAMNRFFQVNDLRLLIRGHQFQCCKENGYRYLFSDKLLTVFSSSNYCGNHNASGFVKITEDKVQPLTLRGWKESKSYFFFNQNSSLV